MIEFLKKTSTWAFAIISALFTFVSDDILKNYKVLKNCPDEVNIVLIHILIYIVIFILSVIVYAIYLKYRKKEYIKGHNYCIKIEYGNIFEMDNCKKVIPFDECFTTAVGSKTYEINPDSICGQYLEKYPIEDMKALIDGAQLVPRKSKSKFQGKECYTSGKLIPRNDYLLLAFAKLDKDGLGRLTREEYLDCLAVLWEEIDKYYGQNDVCIPILGSGVTRMGEVSPTQQELLDMIIYSYKLCQHKLKNPYKLHIVCMKKEDFSLNRIGESF